LLKRWSSFWPPKIIKVDFEAAVINVKSFVGKQQCKVFLQIQKLKEEAGFLSWKLISK
jgi:hypothetical protein